MSEESATRKRGGKRFHLEYSLAGFVAAGIAFVVVLGFFFVLGVLVGRGFIPERLSGLGEIKDQLVQLQEIVSRKDSKELEEKRKNAPAPQFVFPDYLTRPTGEGEEVPLPGALPKKDEKPPAKPQPKEAHQAAQKGKTVTLQIASLESEAEAKKLVTRLQGKGFDAYVTKKTADGKTLYRVRCGKYKDAQEAKRDKARLAKGEKLESIVAKTED